MANNETVKKLDITIKLRGDRVYDVYMDGNFVVSYGNYNHALNLVNDEIKRVFE